MCPRPRIDGWGIQRHRFQLTAHGLGSFFGHLSGEYIWWASAPLPSDSGQAHEVSQRYQPLYQCVHCYEPFKNEPLKNLSAIATNFTDLAYWQLAELASIFKRLPRDRSQIQILNDILGEIWSDIAKQLDTDPQHIQWSINRRWCSKGNSMELVCCTS